MSTETPLLAVRCSCLVPGLSASPPIQFAQPALLAPTPNPSNLGLVAPSTVPCRHGADLASPSPSGQPQAPGEPAGRGHLCQHHHPMQVNEHHLPPQTTTAGQDERSCRAPGPGEATAAPWSSGGSEQGWQGGHRALLPALQQPRR